MISIQTRIWRAMVKMLANTEVPCNVIGFEFADSKVVIKVYVGDTHAIQGLRTYPLIADEVDEVKKWLDENCTLSSDSTQYNYFI